MILAKIVYDEKLHNHKSLSHIFYQDIKIVEKDTRQLPTLIVGWKLINKLLPNYPHDILEREVSIGRSNKIFWEFSPSEDIVQYSHGLEQFLKRIPLLFITRYQYKNVDPFFEGLFSVESLISFLPSGGDLYVYKDDMAYYRHNNTIYGLKLPVYNYIGLQMKSVRDVLLSKSARRCLDDSTEYQKFYKQFPDFGLLKRSMVVFYFL